MGQVSNLSEEPAYKLARLDTVLSVKRVSKLTGLDHDASSRLLEEGGYLEGCSPEELAGLCRSLGVDLPRSFLLGIQHLIEAREGPTRWTDTLIALLLENGLAEAVVDYADFLRLTTFDSSEAHPHTGENGQYSYRTNPEGEIAGITSGSTTQGFGAGEPRRFAADHQRDARLDLPTTVVRLVAWVGRQGGDVQLAIPEGDKYPVSLARWVDAVAAIAGVRDALSPVSSSEARAVLNEQVWVPYNCTNRAKALQRLIVEAVNGLQMQPHQLASQEVIGWLVTNKSKQEIRLTEQGYQYFNGAGWKDLSTSAVAAQLRGLTKIRAPRRP